MVYDSLRHECVLFGGLYPTGMGLADTWVLRTPSPASFTAYGAGCGGSAGVPVLSNAPYSLPWLGDAFRTRVSSLAPTSSVALFATGVASTAPVDLTPFGMPGCYGLVAVAAVDFALATAGVAEWSVTVPNSTTLNGVHLFQQAFVLESGANTAGVIVSNGGDIVVGIR